MIFQLPILISAFLILLTVRDTLVSSILLRSKSFSKKTVVLLSQLVQEARDTGVENPQFEYLQVRPPSHYSLLLLDD